MEFDFNTTKVPVKTERVRQFQTAALCVVTRINDGEREVLMLLRNPKSRTFPNTWGFPGGHVDKGEDYMLTAIRELKEETGLDGHIQYRMKDQSSKMPYTFYSLKVFHVVVDDPTQVPVLSAEEHIDWQWVAIKDTADLNVGGATRAILSDLLSSVAYWWPLEQSPMFPDDPGLFGADRKFDKHTGIDLYCDRDTNVVAMEDGVIRWIGVFTGEKAEPPTPYWNHTEYMMIRGESGVIVYGEITPNSRLKKGDYVEAGDVIGSIKTPVLRKSKGRPTTMLHLELMTHDANETILWELDKPKPKKLLDPTPMLLNAAKFNAPQFSMAFYDGKKYT